MPSTRAPVVKSLDARRREPELRISGEAAMVPDFSGKHDGNSYSERLPPWTGLGYCLYLPLTLFTSHISLLALPSAICLSFLQSFTRHHSLTTNTLTCQSISISFLLRPRLGLVISALTRFRPPASAYTRLGYCHSTRQHHPRVPWPYSFTSTTMSSSEDDQPLGRGTSRVCFLFICFGDAALQSVHVSLLSILTKSPLARDLVKILFPASLRPSCASSQGRSTFAFLRLSLIVQLI